MWNWNTEKILYFLKDIPPEEALRLIENAIVMLKDVRKRIKNIKPRLVLCSNNSNKNKT